MRLRRNVWLPWLGNKRSFEVIFDAFAFARQGKPAGSAAPAAPVAEAATPLLTQSFTLTDPKGLYAEADYRVSRAWLVRAKYDFIDLDHRVAGRAQERYTLETDYTPVPFADLKLSLRRVVPEDAPDENQLLLQWHFYY